MATAVVVGLAAVAPSASTAVVQQRQLTYVANSGSNSVSVIDTLTNTVVDTIMVGTNPQALAITPGGTRVYVANLFSDNVSVISTATNTVTQPSPSARIPSWWTVGSSPVEPSATAVRPR